MKAAVIRKAVGDARREIRGVRLSIGVLAGLEALVIALRRTRRVPALIQVIAPSRAAGTVEAVTAPTLGQRRCRGSRGAQETGRVRSERRRWRHVQDASR